MNRTAYVAFVDPSLRGVDTAIQMIPFHCIPGRRVFSPCAKLEPTKGEEGRNESSQVCMCVYVREALRWAAQS